MNCSNSFTPDAVFEYELYWLDGERRSLNEREARTLLTEKAELGDFVCSEDVRLSWLPVGELGGALRLSSFDGSSTLTASVNRCAAFSAWCFLYAFLAFFVR